jgi:muramidase (phage lysozyme)
MAFITAAQAGGESIVRFLDLLAFSESTCTSLLTKNHGYDVIVSGIDGPEVFTDYRDHPFARGRLAKTVRRVPLLTSSASGRYQLLVRYWRVYRQQLHLPDFSPLSQDLVAIQQIRERRAILPLLADDVQTAIGLCSNIWASLPGNSYGQGGHTMGTLLAKYDATPPVGDILVTLQG